MFPYSFPLNHCPQAIKYLEYSDQDGTEQESAGGSQPYEDI